MNKKNEIDRLLVNLKNNQADLIKLRQQLLKEIEIEKNNQPSLFDIFTSKDTQEHHLSRSKESIIKDLQEIDVLIGNFYNETLSSEENYLYDRSLEDKNIDNLLYFIGFIYSPEIREQMLGDIQERYFIWAEKRGKTRAKLWVIRDAIGSITPIIKLFLENKTVKTLKFLGLVKLIKYFFG